MNVFFFLNRFCEKRSCGKSSKGVEERLNIAKVTKNDTGIHRKELKAMWRGTEDKRTQVINLWEGFC